MSEGFFADVDSYERKPLPLIAQCGACKLYKTCKTPYMKVSGRGERKILIVGEAPGKEEDLQGKQFVGKAGKKLQETCRKLGVDLRRDCWLTNSLICRPPHNRIEKDVQIDYCRPYLLKTIAELNPSTIILLGKSAVRSLIGHLWKEEVGAVTRWVGWQIPCQSPLAWVCPTYHPSYVSREKRNPVVDLWYTRHLAAAFALDGRPSNFLPWIDTTQFLDDRDAAEAIRVVQKGHKRPIAFDYETTTLKPDGPHARIVCCSLSNGERTIAFPWHGKVIPAMKKFLTSDVPKYGANIKFEDRWTRKHLGVRVKNWRHDMTLGAHVLDNRAKITSVKFQAFVRLGVPSYDDDIKPYLKAEYPNDKNRIEEVSLPKLLQYCGTDSLVEWHLCNLFEKEIGGESVHSSRRQKDRLRTRHQESLP